LSASACRSPGQPRPTIPTLIDLDKVIAGKNSGVMENWSDEVRERWSTGVLEYWSGGVLEYWVMEQWSIGVDSERRHREVAFSHHICLQTT
jgi:hypothetical protein